MLAPARPRVLKNPDGQTGPMAGGGTDPITADERTGVLHPDNLETFRAGWVRPGPGLEPVVESYWHVRWSLPPGAGLRQRVVDLPAVTLTIEVGDVVAPLVVTGVHRRAWERTIRGTGEVFGVRLRPAGLAVVSDLDPVALLDATVPVTVGLDAGLHRLLATAAGTGSPVERAAVLDAAFADRLEERPLRPDQALANAVVADLVERVRSRAGPTLAARFGASERAVQRALRATLGLGPKAVSRRIRLQEVARQLAADDSPDLAALAAELGYADQAHLVRDFRAVSGVPPGAYRAEVRGRRALSAG